MNAARVGVMQLKVSKNNNALQKLHKQTSTIICIMHNKYNTTKHVN